MHNLEGKQAEFHIQFCLPRTIEDLCLKRNKAISKFSASTISQPWEPLLSPENLHKGYTVRKEKGVLLCARTNIEGEQDYSKGPSI